MHADRASHMGLVLWRRRGNSFRVTRLVSLLAMDDCIVTREVRWTNNPIPKPAPFLPRAPAVPPVGAVTD